MRILVAGDWHSELHEEAVYRAFEELGHDVCRFSWHDYFLSAASGPFRTAESVIKKFQNKYLIGPVVNRINRDFVQAVNDYRPDAVFIYRGTHITPASLRTIRRDCSDTILVGYNNDDPFAQGHIHGLWRHFLDGLREYDLVLGYRQHNIDDFRRVGAKRVRLLRSWFIPERNHPITLTEEEQTRFGCDVVFAGHYEPDGRLELLEEIARAGLGLRVYGPGKYWNRVVAASDALKHLGPIQQVWGEDYNRALAGAKVALCFLSKLNRDTYTRRCFEIPATGTLLLSEYSSDLATLFREGIEADFFRSKEELLKKLKYYVSNDQLRESVACAGRNRVNTDGHDVVSRMRQVMQWMGEIRAGGPCDVQN